MRQKFITQCATEMGDAVALAIVYDTRSGNLMCGGSVRWREYMEDVLVNLFLCSKDLMYRYTDVAQTKIRYDTQLEEDVFLSGLRKLDEMGWTRKSVTTVGRMVY